MKLNKKMEEVFLRIEMKKKHVKNNLFYKNYIYKAYKLNTNEIFMFDIVRKPSYAY